MEQTETLPAEQQAPETAAADKATESLAPEEKKLTEKEYKNLLRIFFTVRHNTVEPCGHKLDIKREPRGNCPYCWFVYFNTYGEMVQTCDEVFQKHGPKALESLRGKKFVKNFIRFMATLAAMKKLQDAQKESNGESTGSVGSSSRASEDSTDTGVSDPGSTDRLQTSGIGGQVEGAEGGEGAVGPAVQDDELASPFGE